MWLRGNIGRKFSSKTELINSALSDPDFSAGAKRLGIGGEDGRTLKSSVICYRQKFLGGTLGEANVVSCNSVKIREKYGIQIVAAEDGGPGEQVVTIN